MYYLRQLYKILYIFSIENCEFLWIFFDFVNQNFLGCPIIIPICIQIPCFNRIYRSLQFLNRSSNIGGYKCIGKNQHQQKCLCVISYPTLNSFFNKLHPLICNMIIYFILIYFDRINLKIHIFCPVYCIQH